MSWPSEKENEKQKRKEVGRKQDYNFFLEAENVLTSHDQYDTFYGKLLVGKSKRRIHKCGPEI